jgi:hypothetical protein
LLLFGVVTLNQSTSEAEEMMAAIVIPKLIAFAWLEVLLDS